MLSLTRRHALIGTAALVAVTALPIPAPAAPTIDATATELLLAERYDELTALLRGLPADGDYGSRVAVLRLMADMNERQLQLAVHLLTTPHEERDAFMDALMDAQTTA